MTSKSENESWVRLIEERNRLMEMATLNDLLPTFLHELRNPLASIMAMSELTLEMEPPEPFKESLEGILQESKRMKLAFEGLGDILRDLRCRDEQDIGLALIEACGIFKPLFERLGIQLELDLPNLPPLQLEGGGIRGILFNLLTNAKHACKRGDRIHVTAELLDDGEVFRFSVTDTGEGMSPEALANCKKLFFTTKPMGSGIGMSLCQTPIEKLNGSLEIESELGRGTRVSASIPLIAK